jgi:hypothetical protein
MAGWIVVSSGYEAMSDSTHVLLELGVTAAQFKVHVAGEVFEAGDGKCG